MGIKKKSFQKKKFLPLFSSYFDITRKDRTSKAHFKWLRETTKLNAPFMFTLRIVSNEKLKVFLNRKTNYKVITFEPEELKY